MKRTLIFALMLFSVSNIFAQDKKYNPDKHYFKYQSYLAPPPAIDGQCPVCTEGKGFIAQQRYSDKVWLCVQVLNPPKTFESKGDSIKVKVARLEQNDITQNIEINNIKSDVNDLKGKMSFVVEEIKSRPEQVSPKPVEDAVSPYIPPPPPPDTAKADTIVNGRLLYIIDPFTFVAGNKSPAFPSRTIWGAGIETGISIIWKERFTGTATVGYLLTPSFIQETGYSAYGEDKVSIHGLTVNARVGYKLWPFLGINSGYSWSPEKELPDTGGFLYLEAETPLRRIQFLLQAGGNYEHDYLNFFGRGTFRFNFQPK